MSWGLINSAGLLVALLGVILLFLFGMPFHVPTGGSVYLALEHRDERDVSIERRNTVLGWLGLALIVAGTAVQVWVSLETMG